MSPGADLGRYVWWLVSRASGIVALLLVSLAVVLGLAMATGVLRGPGVKRRMVRLHEHVALAGLAAITGHGLALLGDGWLRPGIRGIAVPFAIGYRPWFTGLGIIGGYLAALLGLSFYVRRRIGARFWRRLHRATVVVWLLGAVHTLGAGTDAAMPWMRAIVLVSGAPIMYLTLLRILQSRERRAARRARTSLAPPAGGGPGQGRPAVIAVVEDAA